MIRILVLESDPHLNCLICEYLNNSGFRAEGYFRPENVTIVTGNTSFDLIIAEPAFLERESFPLVRAIRMPGNTTPILFVSESNVLAEQIIEFRLGIDEYMDKPIVMEELLMRVRAILRRANAETDQRVRTGNLELDPVTGSASVNGRIILLPAIEFHILYKLLSYPGRILSRMQLVDEVWGIGSDANMRLVDTYICKLREKFSKYDDFKIVTVRAHGYMAVPAMKK